MLKLLKYILLIPTILILVLCYGIYSWHFNQKTTFLSVKRKCDLIELAKDYCTNEYDELDNNCLAGEVPQKSMLYYAQDFIFGHKCTDDIEE